MSTAEYQPGEWLVAVADGRLAVLPAGTSAEVVAEVWTMLTSGSQLGDLLGVLTRDSFAAIPTSFALVVATGSDVHAVVRGVLDVVLESDDERLTLSGRQVTTWREEVLTGVARVEVGARATEQRASLPLAAGVVLASVVRLTLAAQLPTAVGQSGDARTGAAAAAPAPAVATAWAAAEPAAGLRTAGVVDQAAPATRATPQVVPAAQAVPAAPAVVLPSTSPQVVGDVDDADDGSTILVPSAASIPHQAGTHMTPEQIAAARAAAQRAAARVAGQWPPYPEPEAAERRLSEEERLEAERIATPTFPGAMAPVLEPVMAGGVPDHDGLTILSSDLVELRRQLRSIAVDPSHGAVEITPARIVLSTGQRVSLNRPVLLGRAPEITRVVNAAMPRLITVPSANHDISRTHAEIRQDGDHVLVTDLHSTNGVALLRQGAPAQRLQPGEPTVLEPGAIIDLGEGVTIALETGP